MAFTTDYTQTESILPEGDYECIILSAYVNATPSGSIYFSVRMAVRNDVPQKYQNKNIFHAIWQRKPENQTEDDKKIGGFSYKQIMNLCEAAGLPKGKSYEGLDDLGKDLKDKCVLVTIGHDTWNGRTRERVKWANATKFPECNHVIRTQTPVQTNSAGNTANAAEIVDIPDDGDLPF